MGYNRAPYQEETNMATKHTAPATWNELLEQALTEPGKVAACFRAFHNYSFRNQLLAAWQCYQRGLPVGPMATFKGWKAKDRCVQKGQKALVLCVPIMAKKRDEDTNEERSVLVGFTYKARWFVLAQTSGQDAEPEQVPGWDWDRACKRLGITLVPFEHINGNVQGYSKGNGQVALNPVAAHPARTMLHEMAHALLHPKGSKVARDVAELEAEAVAYLVGATFDLPGAAESRAYMQNWYGQGRAVEEGTATRIFGAVQRILDAGTKEED